MIRGVGIRFDIDGQIEMIHKAVPDIGKVNPVRQVHIKMGTISADKGFGISRTVCRVNAQITGLIGAGRQFENKGMGPGIINAVHVIDGKRVSRIAGRAQPVGQIVRGRRVQAVVIKVVNHTGANPGADKLTKPEIRIGQTDALCRLFQARKCVLLQTIGKIGQNAQGIPEAHPVRLGHH
ncbi:hypothetical protein [Desulfatiferula olefinivorans]